RYCKKFLSCVFASLIFTNRGVSAWTSVSTDSLYLLIHPSLASKVTEREEHQLKPIYMLGSPSPTDRQTEMNDDKPRIEDISKQSYNLKEQRPLRVPGSGDRTVEYRSRRIERERAQQHIERCHRILNQGGIAGVDLDNQPWNYRNGKYDSRHRAEADHGDPPDQVQHLVLSSCPVSIAHQGVYLRTQGIRGDADNGIENSYYIGNGKGVS